MKRINLNKSIFVTALVIGALVVISFSNSSKSKKVTIDYKSSVVSYFGTNSVTKADLVKQAKLIDIADRRFETKWKNKNPKGISEEYIVEGAVFMKPGVKPRLGRADIEKEFTESVKGVDRVEFYQDELEFYGEMDVAFQRCHMLGFVDTKKEHTFEGSYIILWKKENGKWLIHYDMFNSDK
ncbi:YybH family protein [Aquimarina aquimarini]|uniref:YybH family protein n=1 Tax=Aquimarina aquimarini TaxID=1191734 RepID=UPI000D558638|nr:nuclear transport factor 2 family protein [Aquimarina aquimarini]